jgi:hypothetical protein
MGDGHGDDVDVDADDLPPPYLPQPALVRPVLAAALPPALKTAAQTLDASPLHLLRCPSKAVIDARR